MDENHVVSIFFLNFVDLLQKNPHLLSALRNLEKSEIQRFKLTRKYLYLTVVAININITNIKKVVRCYVSNHCCLLVVFSWIGTHSQFKITGELEQLVLLLASMACHAHQTVNNKHPQNTLLTPLIKGVFSKERKGQEVCVCVYGGGGVSPQIRP